MKHKRLPDCIQDYIDLIRSKKYKESKWQFKVCELVEKVFETEDVYVDEKQLEKYLSYQKYFPYALFSWEKFCFALHNCTYKADGTLRFPILIIYIGRGGGKNGYLSFEDFCLLTPTNGIREYDIDIFAMSEEQAKQSWIDVYNILEDNEKTMKKFFYWTKEIIRNLQTNSTFRFNTSAPKTKDGRRPGKVDFDEIHAYTDSKLMDVAITGLGKKKYPRRTYITTDGIERGGVLDDLKDSWKAILDGERPDNGTLPFMCSLDEDEEVDDKKCWDKANPSLRYLPDLRAEIEMEYSDYLLNPAANVSFIAKRMNRPPAITENAVTSWDNILATNQPIDEDLIYGKPCVAGIDYMETTDFLGAGLLYRVDGKDYWVCHTWICSNSRDLFRIKKAPLREWESQGLVTFVDAKSIPPELPCIWLQIEANKRQSTILKVGIDDFRFKIMRNALLDINFSDSKEYNNVTRIRPSIEMKNIPAITLGFVEKRFCWGDNPVMRWMCNNSKTIVSSAGNITYGKIEPKSRKTDTFKAFVAAECVSEILDDIETMPSIGDYGVFTF